MTTKNIKIFVGWDSRENDAYVVCKHSLQRLSSTKLEIEPLVRSELIDKGLYRRKWHRNDVGVVVDDIDEKPFSTEFSFTRFLVPTLMQFEGWAMFVDLDFLYRTDVNKLFSLADSRYAIMCVKHNHMPVESMKMDGVPQTTYPRKNWSSMVLWNCSHPANREVTAEKVNTMPGSWLHRFSWLSDELIGGVPEEWNWLEGHSSSKIKPNAIHYTRGGPWFENYKDVAYAQEWVNEFELAKKA